MTAVLESGGVLVFSKSCTFPLAALPHPCIVYSESVLLIGHHAVQIANLCFAVVWGGCELAYTIYNVHNLVINATRDPYRAVYFTPIFMLQLSILTAN